jgi:hypothetical protein
MTKLDGSTQHAHQIYNFSQSGDTHTEGNVTTVKGTSTVKMKEGPVHDVKTEITISQGKVIAIKLDPDATDNHFGDTPIYGITITPQIMQHIICQSGTAANMTGMMGDRCSTMQGNTTSAMTGKMWK